MDNEPKVDRSYTRDHRFWSVIIALSTMVFLGFLENTVKVTVSRTAFLNYAAVQPLFRQLSNLFGRRFLALLIVAIYILGSGISGGANYPAMLITGRAIQGAGSGGMTMIVSVIISDLVPLRDRGYFQAIIAMTFGIGMAIGPVIGGLIVQNISWRWVFYINLPVGGLSLVLLWLFLHVKWDRETKVRDKLKAIDIIGNTVLVASTVSILIALTWAGAIHSWSSYQIIVPLVMGVLGLIGFCGLEGSTLVPNPVMPLRLFANRTSMIVYANTFLVSMLNYWIFFFLPIYFQSVKLSTPSRSGVQILPITFILIPGAAIGAIVLSSWGKYKLLHIGGFALLTAGMGYLSVLDKGSNTAEWVCLQIILPSLGAGIVVDTLLPAFQTGVAESDSAAATASWTFIRSFGNIWGVAIPSAIFNSYTNQYAYDIIDSSAQEYLLHGDAYSSATKAFVEGFPMQAQSQIIEVFTKALSKVFMIATAFSGLAFVLSFIEGEVELRTELTTDFGLEEKEPTGTSNKV
ncbi:major facilitator superfamily domain-containing protein [Daldinia decipiens]|uniref:major facilitator superfamily domain-containing protein n=1 Tax=Daldinia decipiens TaxID=326647 RepID=UPI0020C226C3|nr:major facilitator superfamily domain-containing protein [Daldinia decipiens]KAI1653385.1 major facilitator superfamily domain-containing protein [Daldinia decipiens]